MAFNIVKLHKADFPERLRQIPQPPKQLFMVGDFPETKIYLAVVGSRKYTSYGKECVQHLVGALAGESVTIVSGLAYGIDSLAHEAALEAGLKTIAVPGSGLGEKVLYPKQHYQLAKRIVDSGGCLLSEYDEEFVATQWAFPQRNRIMAGLSHAVLLIEAGQRSGTLITARMALDYNRDVLAVPGPIFSPTSVGTNKLLHLGATPITCAEDLLEALHIERDPFTNTAADRFKDCAPDELRVLEILYLGPVSRDDLIRQLSMTTQSANILLSMMEINGFIKEEAGEIRINF